MNGSLPQKRIPTILALAVIALGIFGTSYLTQNLGPLLTRATTSETPQNIKTTNVSDNSFTVSWTTTDESAGSISFWEEGKEPTTALDDRDKPDAIGRYKTHHITIQKLKSSTKYLFKIQSGKSSFDNNGSNYSLITGPTIETFLSVDSPLIEGSVANEDGSAGRDILVYINIEEAAPLSTFTSSKGLWKTSLALRPVNLDGIIELSPADVLKILATNGVKNSEVNTGVRAEIPIITLGQNYNFVIDIKSDEATKSASPSGQKVEFGFTVSPPPSNISTPKITKPGDNEKFIDLQPRFSGTALKGTTVEITIESETIKSTVKTDNNGNWSFRPAQQLTAGEHTITIKAPDSGGVIRAITRKFQVFAAGQQVEEPATPSATPTVKLSPTPTTTISASPTANPMVTVAPTNAPIPTKAPKAPPVTGVFDESLPLIGLGAFGIITFIIGLALLF